MMAHGHKQAFYTPKMEWQKLHVRGWTPGAREGHSAAEVDGRMYVFGGIERGARVNSTVVLDTSLGEEGVQWYQLEVSGDIPPPRCFHTSWAVGDLLFVHGGECASVLGGTVTHDSSSAAGGEGHHHDEQNDALMDPESAQDRPKRICTDDLYCLDTQTGVWSHLPTRLSPLPRKGHSAVVMYPGGAGMVTVFGGSPSGTGQLFGDVHTAVIEDLGNRAIWSVRHTKGPAPCARYGHSCVASTPTTAVVYGGMDIDGQLLGDLHALDVTSFYWSELVPRGQSPTPRYGHASTTVRGQMVMFGGVVQGEERKTFSRELFIFNFESNCWAEVLVGHSFPGPRYGHTVVATDSSEQRHGAVLVFGGLHSMYCSSDTWKLSIGKAAQEATQPLTREDRLHLDPSKIADVEAVIMEARRDMLFVEQQLIAETRERVQLASTIDDMRSAKEHAELELMRVQEEAREEVEGLRQELQAARRLTEELAAEKEEAYKLIGLLELSANLRLSAWREHAKAQSILPDGEPASLMSLVDPGTRSEFLGNIPPSPSVAGVSI